LDDRAFGCHVLIGWLLALHREAKGARPLDQLGLARLAANVPVNNVMLPPGW
jgi:hypothetical protein